MKLSKELNLSSNINDILFIWQLQLIKEINQLYWGSLKVEADSVEEFVAGAHYAA
jgi:hypothetical protein